MTQRAAPYDGSFQMLSITGAKGKVRKEEAASTDLVTSFSVVASTSIVLEIAHGAREKDHPTRAGQYVSTPSFRAGSRAGIHWYRLC